MVQSLTSLLHVDSSDDEQTLVEGVWRDIVEDAEESASGDAKTAVKNEGADAIANSASASGSGVRFTSHEVSCGNRWIGCAYRC